MKAIIVLAIAFTCLPAFLDLYVQAEVGTYGNATPIDTDGDGIPDAVDAGSDSDLASFFFVFFFVVVVCLSPAEFRVDLRADSFLSFLARESRELVAIAREGIIAAHPPRAPSPSL